MQPRARVGLVSEQAAFFGGGQVSLRDLAFGLRGGPVEPVVILPAAGPLSEALEAGGVPWVPLALPAIRPSNALGVFAAVAGLARLARARGLDILHSDAPRAALYAGLAAGLARRRHVWHVRASRASSALADRLALLLSDRVIAVSRAAAGRSRPLRDSRKVRVVPTGVPPIVFLDRAAARAALGLPADRFIAGVIGRLEPDKGSDDAIAALVELRAADPRALLAFLGSEDPGSRWGEVCRQQAAAADLSGAVLFLGARPEAACLLPAFDILLHPSRHEALPRVLIEALFAGVPSVAAAVGGVPDAIESGVSGLLVPPHHPRALGRAAAGLARDPSLRRRLAAAGRERARTLFRLETMLEGILSVYAELLIRSGRWPEPARLVAR